MPRPAGRRNADFAASRDVLLDALYTRLAAPGGASASFRDLAAAAAVSVPTLRHYFGDRDGLVRAVLERRRRLGEVHLRHAAEGPPGGLPPLAASVRALLEYTLAGFERGGLGALHALGLAAGLGHEALGPAYLAETLEPTLQAFEARLARHRDAGELRDDVDLRHAALVLVGPLLLLLLHQGELGGRRHRAADVRDFVARHADAFVRAFGRPRRARRAIRTRDPR